jgi:ribosomal protein L21E
MRLFHFHSWKVINESMGRSNFHGIAGDVVNVRVKAVTEQCAICNKVRAYLIAGRGQKYQVNPGMVQ